MEGGRDQRGSQGRGGLGRGGGGLYFLHTAGGPMLIPLLTILSVWKKVYGLLTSVNVLPRINKKQRISLHKLQQKGKTMAQILPILELNTP